MKEPGLVNRHAILTRIGGNRHPKLTARYPARAPRQSTLTGTEHSRAFGRTFAKVTAAQTVALIGRHPTYRKRGPIIAGTDVISDDNGVVHEVRLEGFCNTYSVMTLGVILRAIPVSP